MKNDDNKTNKEKEISYKDFFENFWEESLTYIKTVVDVVREPVLILDKDFRVLAANNPFYDVFQVESQDTENKIVYNLGNGQWNIPELRRLLEDILPQNSFFKGFEVAHDFPVIGQKVMILNARQIHFNKNNTAAKAFPPIILLAIEDITDIMQIAETLASYTHRLEAKLVEQSDKLELNIKKLQKEIDNLKKKK
jgi:two-component system, chemotaxis family, CheB/CheR fusion protein